MRADAQPAAGEGPFAAVAVGTSQVQRAQVREATREAAIHGQHPLSGELS